MHFCIKSILQMQCIAQKISKFSADLCKSIEEILKKMKQSSGDVLQKNGFLRIGKIQRKTPVLEYVYQ